MYFGNDILTVAYLAISGTVKVETSLEIKDRVDTMFFATFFVCVMAGYSLVRRSGLTILNLC